MNPRARRRVDTGFKSVHHLLVCVMGVYGFWFQLTRIKPNDQQPWLIGVCVLMMATPSLAFLYQAVNMVYSATGRVLKAIDETAAAEDERQEGQP